MGSKLIHTLNQVRLVHIEVELHSWGVLTESFDYLNSLIEKRSVDIVFRYLKAFPDFYGKVLQSAAVYFIQKLK
jgi:hypothetical protein